MKIEIVTPIESSCKTGDFIYSNDSDITYMIAETKESYILLNIKTGVEYHRAPNILKLLEFLNNTNKVIIPNDDVTIVLKSNSWKE